MSNFEQLKAEATKIVEHFNTISEEDQRKFRTLASQLEGMAAHFSVSERRLKKFRIMNEERAYAKLDIEIFAVHENESVATGNPQDVMHLIGEVASQGEDFLIRSYRF